MATIQALALSIEAKDPYTRGHSERVTQLAVDLGETMGLSAQTLECLRFGAILHDIGKIGIPESILNKPGPLSTEERAVIQKHSAIGAEIISDIHFLKKARSLILHHHERYDGTGYPSKLKGSEMSLLIKILSVCDAFDAMASNRPYRPARSLAECLQEITDKAGTQFDPEVAKLFIEMVSGNPQRYYLTNPDSPTQISNPDDLILLN